MALPKPLRVGSTAALTLLLGACSDDPGGPVLCTTIVDYTIGETVSGSLGPGDCQLELDLSFVDFYRLSSPSQSVEFSFSSGAFNPFLYLLRGAGFDAPAVAFDGDGVATTGVLHVLMAPDTYVVGANSFHSDGTGSYALSSAVVSDQAANCAEIWVMRGIAAAQSIETTDCIESGQVGDFYSDEFLVLLGRGESITVTMASTAFDSYLFLVNSRDSTVAENNNFGGGSDARIVYNVAVDDVFIIVAATFDPDTTGAYALTVN